MTINGGQPHRVGYTGQRYKITVYDRDQDRRRVLAWSNAPVPPADLSSLETHPAWSEARCEDVADLETGDATPPLVAIPCPVCAGKGEFRVQPGGMLDEEGWSHIGCGKCYGTGQVLL